MKTKPEEVIITKKIWRDLVVDTLYNVFSLINSSRILLKENIKENRDVKYEDPHVSAALYIFAIEEFGKALILQEYKSVQDEVTIQYKYEFLDHTKKFEKGLKELPAECHILHKGNFGANYGANFDIDEYASIEARFDILYSDLNDQKNINILPQIDVEKLEIGLEKFSGIAENNLADFNTKN